MQDKTHQWSSWCHIVSCNLVMVTAESHLLPSLHWPHLVNPQNHQFPKSAPEPVQWLRKIKTMPYLAACIPGGQDPHWARDFLSSSGAGWEVTDLMPSSDKKGCVTIATTCCLTFHQVKSTHIPWLAHIPNLVVQLFLVRYPGFHDVLPQSRQRNVHPLQTVIPSQYSPLLIEIQCKNKLLANCLICDMHRHWKWTLAMLQ